jgi:hypothetical protein
MKISTDAEIGDIKKARLLLKSVIQSNPAHAPGWYVATVFLHLLLLHVQCVIVVGFLTIPLKDLVREIDTQDCCRSTRGICWKSGGS